MTQHALSIDLEDWHQGLRKRLGYAEAPLSAHVGEATLRLLDLLDATGSKATFFVVGLLASARPDLVREVVRRGHEVGSHSHAHALVHTMTPAAFRDEMRQTRAFLQDLSGQPVRGFRAPEFSVQALGHWSFDVLAEVGFAYDSSVFPVRARYGIPDAPRTPFVHQTAHGPLAEFPLATLQVGRMSLPVAGGSYFRLVPGAVLSRAVAALDAAGTPATLYFHPYEFQAGWLHLSGLTNAERLRPGYLKYLGLHNLATGRISARLAALLGRFRFGSLASLYDERFA